MYAKVGVNPPDDIYLFDKADPLRKVVKCLLLILLNATSRSRALNAFKKEIESQGVTQMLTDRGFTADTLYTRFYNHHAAIRGFFHSGVGVELQFQDSLMANDIMTHFTMQNKPILPCHDSFICAEQHEGELVKVMKEVFNRYFGTDIPVK